MNDGTCGKLKEFKLNENTKNKLIKNLHQLNMIYPQPRYKMTFGSSSLLYIPVYDSSHSMR